MNFRKRDLVKTKRKTVHLLKWLQPGLLIKRWIFLSILGGLLLILGLTISAGLTPILFITRNLDNLVSFFVTMLPRHVSGPLAILLGIILLLLGQKRLLGSITRVLMPNDDKELVDLLISHHKLNRGAKLVAIGGGTGLSNLLRGLKKYSANITAIVTVADDGGSSGRLRREHGVLPPGDIRNCLAALADEERLVTELFQYRFTTGEGLEGHSFGNLFLTAMSEITGDLEKAITASSQVLAVRGQVLPATLTDMVLWARLEDGRYIEGESNITAANGAIAQIGCKPNHPVALPRAVAEIMEADLIVIGPGSLYTSIIPNLLVPDIAEAIAQRRAPCVYVCNIMSQPGETQNYSVSDHIKALDNVLGVRVCDVVLIQKGTPSPKTLQHYAENGGSHFIQFDRENLTKLNCPYLLADVMEQLSNGKVRHDAYKLAGVLMRWYNRQ
jgi:uncharacterized cofD-like protein